MLFYKAVLYYSIAHPACGAQSRLMPGLIQIPNKIGKMSVHVHQLHYGPDICRLNAMKYGRKLV